MESLFDVIEYVPDSPVVLPEWPKESLGVINTDGFYMYSKKEWEDVSAVKKDWYSKAEYFSIYWMHEGANNYVSNPSPDYDIGKIISVGKERSAKSITMTKDAWKSDMVHDLFKNK